ncbi:hypothetical protein AO368_1590 [Moraxella catarrhalis]|nr:hypothetical protein AO368_1590 [Moraxella catarrhalis]
MGGKVSEDIHILSEGVFGARLINGACVRYRLADGKVINGIIQLILPLICLWRLPK